MKKNQLIGLVSLAMAIFFVASCSKEEIKSSAASISKFSFSALETPVIGTIDAATSTITLEVPYGVDYTSLVPTIIISEFATIDPAAGIAQDFTNDVVYTVTAEDGSTQSYTVSVVVKHLLDFESVDLSEKTNWHGPLDVSPSNEQVFGYDVVIYRGFYELGNAQLANVYNQTWASWQGFAFSKETDMETAGSTNQYSVYNTEAAGATVNFGVVYAPENSPAVMKFKQAVMLNSFSVTNATYAYLAMKNGDNFTTAYAEGDYLQLVVKGFATADATNSVFDFTVDLAKYTSSQQFMADQWIEVTIDENNNTEIMKLEFELKSSQNSTPAYACVDEFDFTVKK